MKLQKEVKKRSPVEEVYIAISFIFISAIIAFLVINLGSAILFGDAYALYQGLIFGVLAGSGVLIQF